MKQRFWASPLRSLFLLVTKMGAKSSSSSKKSGKPRTNDTSSVPTTSENSSPNTSARQSEPHLHRTWYSFNDLFSSSWEGTVFLKIPPEVQAVIQKYHLYSLSSPFFSQTDLLEPTLQKIPYNRKSEFELTTAGPCRAYPSPSAIAVDPWTGNLYVADINRGQIQVFKKNGRFFKFFGDTEVHEPGASDGYFKAPSGLLVNFDGNLVVLDSGNSRVQIFDLEGRMITKIGRFGLETGEFQGPYGMAMDHEGNLVIADTGNNRIQVHPTSPIFF